MNFVRRRPAARTGLTTALLPILVAGALLAGCGDDRRDEPAPEEPAVEPQDKESQSETPGPGGDSEVVRNAAADLAERQGVDAATIEVVSVEEVTWRNGSLGCAEPGMAYTQALVPGQRIVLQVDGKRYNYHAARGKDARYCAKPTE